MTDRVQDDVGHVIVGKGVLDLAGLAAGGNDAGGTQYAQMLGNQRLADAECGHQLVHVPTAGRQLTNDPQPHWGGERLEQLTGGLKRLVSRRRRHMQKLAYCNQGSRRVRAAGDRPGGEGTCGRRAGQWSSQCPS